VFALSRARAHAIIDRCAAIDWRLPSRDARRITAAYQRWQAMLGLVRPIRLITDPIDLPPTTYRSSDDGWDAGNDSIGAVWPSAAGALLLRTMWPTVSPPFAPEWDIATAWASAFTRSRSRAEESLAEVMADLKSMMALVSRIAAAGRANHWAMMLLNMPLLGLFDSPSRIASVAFDLLAASDNDTVWQRVAGRGQVRKIARALGLGSDGLNSQPQRDDLVDAIISLCEPMIDACESGAFAHVLKDGELVVLASPPIWTDGRRLHRADGPAIAWRETKVYAWKGRVVPKRFIMQPMSTRPDDIRLVADASARRSLIDLYAYTHGYRRCMQDFGGVVIEEDAAGRLWSVRPDPQTLVSELTDVKLVEVVNGTAETGGLPKTYWLSVPPSMQTAQEAVAWTYGMTSHEYSGLVVRT